MRKVTCYLAIVSIFMLSSFSMHSEHPFPANAWANAGPDDSVCENSSYDIMLAAASGYSTLLWTSSGNGTFNDPTLLHPTYTPGFGDIGPITLTLTAYAVPPGSNASDDMILTIYDGPEANFTISPSDSICSGEEITFNGIATTSIVSWQWDFGDGAYSVLQDPTYTYMASGIYNVSLIVLNTDGCTDTVTQMVQVNDLPTCDFTMLPGDTAYINESVNFTGIGTPDILSWDWDFGDGNIGFGQITNHTYVTPGTYDVRLIVYNGNSCRDTMIKQMIVIDPLIDFNMSPSPSCVDYLVAFTGIGGIGPGVYEWDFGDGNTAVGQNVTHTYTDPGIFHVELTFGPDQVQHDLDVIEAAYANAGPDDDWPCGNEPYLLLGIAYNNTYVLWSSSGDGSFNDPSFQNPTYSPGPGDIASGSAILTLTAYGIMPCQNDTDEMTLTIYPGPEANAGPDTVSCDGVPITLDGYAANQVSNSWSTSGDGTFDDPSLLNATYTAGTNDINNGSVILTLTATASPTCTDAIDDMMISYSEQPTAAAGDDDMTCGYEAYTLSGSASNYSTVVWTSSGDGSFDDPSLLNASYTPGTGDINIGSVNLTITATNQPCADATDEMLLTILASPIANAGDDDGICQGETYTLAGTATNYDEISWSTDGDGNFDDPGILDPTYTPGPTDIANKGATLTLSATAISPCTIGMMDAMLLGVDPMVGNPANPDGPSIVDSYLNPTSQYEIEETPEANGYKWTLSPSTAGDIDGTDITGLVTWNTSFQGFAYVKVTAYNSCAEITSDSLEIEVTTTVGFADYNQEGMEVKIIPNPSKGNFKVEIKDLQQELSLIIYDSFGSIVRQISIGAVGHYEHSFDLSHLPKGMYILKLYGTNVTHKEKIIIQ